MGAELAREFSFHKKYDATNYRFESPLAIHTQKKLVVKNTPTIITNPVQYRKC